MKSNDREFLRLGVSAGILAGVIASIFMEIMTRLLIISNEHTGLGILWTVVSLLLFVVIITVLEFLIVKILAKVHDKNEAKKI